VRIGWSNRFQFDNVGFQHSGVPHTFYHIGEVDLAFTRHTFIDSLHAMMNHFNAVKNTILRFTMLTIEKLVFRHKWLTNTMKTFRFDKTEQKTRKQEIRDIMDKANLSKISNELDQNGANFFEAKVKCNGNEIQKLFVGPIFRLLEVCLQMEPESVCFLPKSDQM